MLSLGSALNSFNKESILLNLKSILIGSESIIVDSLVTLRVKPQSRERKGEKIETE